MGETEGREQTSGRECLHAMRSYEEQVLTSRVKGLVCFNIGKHLATAIIQINHGKIMESTQLSYTYIKQGKMPNPEGASFFSFTCLKFGGFVGNWSHKRYRGSLLAEKGIENPQKANPPCLYQAKIPN